MRLTSYTNYSLRILMYCALHRDRLVTIPEVAAAYDISRAHLLKSARHLGQLGYLRTVRGRNGGIALARAPEAISIGNAVRDLEDTGDFVECFNPARNRCRIAGTCKLTGLLQRGLEGFYRELDGSTLADLVADETALRNRLALVAVA
jgi:Rrf2 family nitric oxide-sensitive transcriptional repressor